MHAPVYAFSLFCICHPWTRGRRDSLMTPLSKGEKMVEKKGSYEKGGAFWRRFENLEILKFEDHC